MCFAESDDYCEVWRQDIRMTRPSKKPCRCCSCRRVIEVGEQRLHTFYVFEGDADSWDLCNQCTQDWVAIHRAELRAGCPDYGSWCEPEEIHRTIRRGNADECSEPEFAGDDERGYVLFWPYIVAPAAKAIDLRTLATELGIRKRDRYLQESA